jgi:hypothetical protein
MGIVWAELEGNRRSGACATYMPSREIEMSQLLLTANIRLI